jgi:exodeoxyribonuclease VIII
MAVHLMVDLETLDTKVSAIILTLGAVKFDPFSDSEMKELYLRISIDSQDPLGCTVSDDTIKWWKNQNTDVMEEAFNPRDRIPIQEAMNQFHSFAWNCDQFWSHGSSFDLMILQNIYDRLGRAYPWNYWQLRDTRTLFDLAEPEMPQDSKHNALEDAKRQATGVRNCFRKLNYKGKKWN